jgi:hypothetical protein
MRTTRSPLSTFHSVPASPFFFFALFPPPPAASFLQSTPAPLTTTSRWSSLAASAADATAGDEGGGEESGMRTRREAGSEEGDEGDEEGEEHGKSKSTYASKGIEGGEGGSSRGGKSGEDLDDEGRRGVDLRGGSGRGDDLVKEEERSVEEEVAVFEAFPIAVILSVTFAVAGVAIGFVGSTGTILTADSGTVSRTSPQDDGLCCAPATSGACLPSFRPSPPLLADGGGGGGSREARGRSGAEGPRTASEEGRVTVGDWASSASTVRTNVTGGVESRMREAPKGSRGSSETRRGIDREGKVIFVPFRRWYG